MSLKFWGVRDEGKISSILLNFRTFEGSFLHIFMGKKKRKIRVSIHCSIGTKKLIHKSEININFVF